MSTSTDREDTADVVVVGSAAAHAGRRLLFREAASLLSGATRSRELADMTVAWERPATYDVSPAATPRRWFSGLRIRAEAPLAARLRRSATSPPCPHHQSGLRPPVL